VIEKSNLFAIFKLLKGIFLTLVGVIY
jgi:hypothetical protein